MPRPQTPYRPKRDRNAQKAGLRNGDQPQEAKPVAADTNNPSATALSADRPQRRIETPPSRNSQSGERSSERPQRSAGPRERRFEPSERRIEPRERSSEPRGRSFESRERPFQSRERSDEPRQRSFETRQRSFEPRERTSEDRDRSSEPRMGEGGASDSTGYVVGRRAALELLNSEEGREKIEKVYLAHGVQGPQIGEIVSLVRRNHVAHTELDRRKFRDLELRVAENTDSQGIIILTALRAYQTIEGVLGSLAEGEKPLFIALDGLEDPHNVGAILRSAEASGTHAVLLHQMRASLTPAVYKTSAGAAEHVSIIKYGNLDQTIRMLRDEYDFTILGLAGEGEKTIYETDLTGPTLLITGSEEKGLHHLIRERCDALIKIPLTGKTQSLNASVATAVALFEAVRQRARLE